MPHLPLSQLSRSLLNKIESETKELKESAQEAISTNTSSPSSSTSSDQVPSSRQTHIDSSIRSAISSELSRLRKQEADVRAQIQAAIEKENLDVESKWASQKDGKAGGRSSIALQKELDEVRAKISGHDERRKRVEAAPGVKEAREGVVKCYKEKLDSGRTLDCWAEVRKFREAVEGAEKVSRRVFPGGYGHARLYYVKGRAPRLLRIRANPLTGHSRCLWAAGSSARQTEGACPRRGTERSRTFVTDRRSSACLTPRLAQAPAWDSMCLTRRRTDTQHLNPTIFAHRTSSPRSPRPRCKWTEMLGRRIHSGVGKAVSR